MAYEGTGSSAYSGGGESSYGLNGSGGNSLGSSSSSSSNNFSTNRGPGSFMEGVPYTPGFWDSVQQFATDNAGTIGKIGGTLFLGGAGGLAGQLAGEAYKAYSKGDYANQITNYHPDGTVTGYNPQSALASGGLGSSSVNLGGSSGPALPGGTNAGVYLGSGVYGGNTWTPTNNSGGLTLSTSAAKVDPTAGMSNEQKQAYWASQAALQNTQLNRPDQSTPFGSQTWTKDPNDPNKWISNISLSPDQQALLDAQNKGNLAKNELANGLLAGFQKDGAPGWVGNANLQTDLALKSDLALSPITAKAATAASANAGAGSIDLTGMTALPEVSDAVRQRVEQALYERSTSRLDPVWQQRQDALNAQLANQGITLGSGAFDTSVGQFGRDRNDAYQLALNEAIVGGGTEQSRLFDLALKPRQQEFSERSKAADVSLANAQMQTNARIASAENATRAAIANAQMELEAAKLNAQNQIDLQNSNNTAALNQGTFNNNAKLGNMAANNSAIDQIVNTIGKLSSGAGPTIPTFNSGMSGANVATVDAAALRQQEYLKQQAKDNAKTQSDNSLYSALGGLANSFISDTNLFG